MSIGLDFFAHQVVSWASVGPEAALEIAKRWEGYHTSKHQVEKGKLNFPVDVSSYIHGVTSGVMDPDKVRSSLAYHGFRASLYNNTFFQHHVFAGNADSMLDQQFNIDPAFQVNGTSAIDYVVFENARVPSGDDVLTLLNRKNINEQTAHYYLMREGFRDKYVRDAVLSLRNEIPPIADLIRFAVRDAFYPDIVKDYGEANEYPKILDKYIDWQGMGWKTGYMAPDSVDADGNAVPAHEATWGEISWFAHWELPAPTMAYDMYRQLYEVSRYGPSPRVLNQNGNVDPQKRFTSGDLNRLLRAAAYPSYWRPKLIAISEPPLSRVDLRRMYQLGVIDQATVYHNYRAQGYGDQNAEYLTQFTVAKDRPNISKQVCHLYQSGVLSDVEAINIMIQNKMTEEEARFEILSCDLDKQAKFIDESVKAIHKGVTTGEIEYDQGRALLSQLGVIPDRIKDYLAVWDIEIQGTMKQLNLSMITSWYVDGIIDGNDYIGRLQRLKYRDKDISVLLKAATRKIDTATRKEREKEDKAAKKSVDDAVKQAEKQRKALEKAAKDAAKVKQKQLVDLEKAQKEKEKLLSEENKALQKQLKAETEALAKGATDKNLYAYWHQGVITIPEIRLRLAARGEGQSNIDKWIDTYIIGGVKP